MGLSPKTFSQPVEQHNLCQIPCEVQKSLFFHILPRPVLGSRASKPVLKHPWFLMKAVFFVNLFLSELTSWKPLLVLSTAVFFLNLFLSD